MIQIKTNKQKEDIENLVSSYVSKKEWNEGDWVQYAGPYFTNDEYVNTIECLLGGWLALGDNGLRFESCLLYTSPSPRD